MFKFKKSWGATMLLVLVFASIVKAEGITILAPLDGASVSSKDILIIGKTGEEAKEVEIKGIGGDALKVKVTKGAFFAKVKLPSDNNKITFTADDNSTTELNIKAEKTGDFHYHPDESEVGNCSTCHKEADSKGYSINPAAPVCYECHDENNKKEFVHGPVNMGICHVCHTSHGSNNASFLISNKKELCDGCHESLTSTHPDAKSKMCLECHDPHSSDKKFHIK